MAELLRWNASTCEYVVHSTDKAKAEGTGLTRSLSARGPGGIPVYFTQDPYAALNFYQAGDFVAQDRLGFLMSRYDASWALDSPNSYPGGNITLRPYQNAGIDYVLDCFNRNNHALVADEPGVGKSYTGIGIANALEAQRVLVITPGRIRKQWRDNIKIASAIPKVRVHTVTKGADGVATWAHYVVISYDLTRNPHIHEALCAIDWGLLIIDEAQALKEIDARRTQAIFGGGRRKEFKDDPLVDHCKHVVALTGTPLPNRPRECWTLTKALCHEAIDFMGEDAFRYRFNPSARMTTDDGKTYNREDRGRLPELHARLRCNFMVRRLKEQVLPWLPDKSYEFAYVDTTGDIADIIRRERMLDYRIDDLKKPFSTIDGELSTIRREMGEAKLPQAIQHIRYLLDDMEIQKLVIFSHHRSVMDGLRDALAEYGVVELRGGMSDRQAENSKLMFIQRPQVRVFSGQIEAAGVGMDGLQRVASYVLIVEPSWVPSVNEQAIDRLHRDGQHDNVIAQFLVAEGSLDETILASVIDKTYNTHQVLDKRKKRTI